MSQLVVRRVLFALACSCAGCFDFSRFDQLPDAAVHDASVPGLDLRDASAEPDLGALADLSGLQVLLDEPFDEASGMVDWLIWDPGSSMNAYSLESSLPDRHAGVSALHVDRTSLTPGATGQLMWLGSLPSQATSIHVRYWYRYAGMVATNINTINLTHAGEGITITITKPAGTPLAVLLDYGGPTGQHFNTSSTQLQPDTWYCLELGLDYTGNDMWSAGLQVDGILLTDVAIAQTDLDTPMQGLSIGLGMTDRSQTAVTDVWVDSLLVTRGTDWIGCND